jgi:rhodanese-related sulfurtransferase
VRSRRSEIRRVIGEAVVVAVVGAVFALAANQISPRGLKLTHNYFPGSKTGSTAASLASGAGSSRSGDSNRAGFTGDTPNGGASATNAPSAAELLAQRLRENGLHLIELAQVRQLAQDPRARQGLILFIDARNPESYRAGHVPGAVEFDPYHPEQYASSVVPLCQVAEQVVVYCTGGDCEDSEFAAIALRDAGVPAERLFVYGGGITEWKASGLPMETGQQNSGNPGDTK